MGAGGQQQMPGQVGAAAQMMPPIPSNDDYASDPEVWDLVVVGAGVAGCALAHTLGKEGRRVLVIERDLSQPDRIVGELLQPGGYAALQKLGLQQCCDSIDAQKVYGYCMFKDGDEACIGYPSEGQSGEVAGRSFHNGRFVQRLRQEASAVPSVTMRQGVVKQLLDEEGREWEDGHVVTGVSYTSATTGPRGATGHLTVVCDGMYSGLRKRLSEPKISHPSYFVGLLLRSCVLPHPNYGHVVLAKPSPILFYPISSTEVRTLVDVPGEKLPSAATGALQVYLRSQVAPQVPPQLRDSFLQAISDGRVRSMQNKSMPAAPLHRPGALLLGDAFNMRHPLTGGGMTVALTDTQLLCDMLRPLPDFSDALLTANTTAAFYTRRKPLSATINTLANALYQVFCYTGDRAHEEMRGACFDYLRLGGIYSSGPISLLSGLNPRPSVLVMHFFMVAVFGIGRLLKPRPTCRGLWLGVLLLWGAAAIILPIIRAEGIRAVFAPWLVRKPAASAHRITRNSSRIALAGADRLR
mmetsp:Transcript_2009/g.5981  ORF Transcript_2009/g.5981 Transcript_2009/m.5981 type:complete len:524 (-) Transcript_2009:1883-3454(-)|eukprot:CAMPEP_0206137742 /NCGR_PEP_ID=MMETSP1473-20131121/2808_1 /ASSEMBLY_ACC=CAM_ASM_001109 /TAXON_ID=1461547 /ORGANISM="Stichococcus sp, Strain RCC1054" /LENGTH=523 /DNA_ID=CAMNT_0053530963 /DNA_START=145 /DNA_END=1716 /DNA_ORIENTATION=+